MKLKEGIILIDIMMALSLSLIFIVIISDSAAESRDIFLHAQERNNLLNSFEASSTTIITSTRPYGNDWIQTDSTVKDSSGISISFTAVRALASSITSKGDGTPICSADFGQSSVTGSYQAANVSNASTSLNITAINLPINPLLPLTDIEVREGTAYISSDSSNASDPDLFVIDVSNPATPKLISSINTGPGISAITLHGKRIYAAAASTAAQLHVIRFDVLNAPILEKKYKLPLPYATATPPLASSIFYKNDRIYLGTEKWDGDEFSIIDVSNPASPTKVGGLETGSKVNDILVKNNTAYIAASDEKQLRLIDVKDSANPTVINSFSPSGWARQEGKSLSSFEDDLNFGRTSGGYDITTDHELFAWATTSTTTLLSPQSVNEKGGIYGIVQDRSHLFTITHEVNRELITFMPNSFGNPFATSSAYSLPVIPQMLTCDGDKLYILAHSSPTLYEITFK